MEQFKPEKKSSFTPVPGTDIGYGPRLERVSARESATETESEVESMPEEWSLNESERYDLGKTLRRIALSASVAVGSGLYVYKSEQTVIDETQGPVTVAAAAAPTAAVPTDIIESKSIYQETQNESVPATLEAHEQVANARFDAVVTDFVQEALEQRDYEKIIAFGSKPVVGAPDFSRLEYVKEQIQFTPYDEELGTGVPVVVAEELRRLIAGLCAQESKFDASSISKVGAKGIFQFMPVTWESYGGKAGEERSLRQQVEVAGKFISDLHRQLLVKISQPTRKKLQAHFGSETNFQLELLVPLIFNAYHAGAGRVAEAVEQFVLETDRTKWPAGKDLFLAVAAFAEAADTGKYLDAYRQDTAEYVPRVYAQHEVLSMLTDHKNTQLASTQ